MESLFVRLPEFTIIRYFKSLGGTYNRWVIAVICHFCHHYYKLCPFTVNSAISELESFRAWREGFGQKSKQRPFFMSIRSKKGRQPGSQGKLRDAGFLVGWRATYRKSKEIGCLLARKTSRELHSPPSCIDVECLQVTALYCLYSQVARLCGS